MVPKFEERTDSRLSGPKLTFRDGKGVAMRAILGELLLLSCIALFIAGIVVALASLVI